MSRYFKTAFGENGDRTTVPDESVDNNVSYVNGYTPDYSLSDEGDPNRKVVERERHNSILHDVTSNIKEIQDQGALTWTSERFAEGNPDIPYGMSIIHEGTLYQWVGNSESDQTLPPGQTDDWILPSLETTQENLLIEDANFDLFVPGLVVGFPRSNFLEVGDKISATRTIVSITSSSYSMTLYENVTDRTYPNFPENAAERGFEYASQDGSVIYEQTANLSRRVARDEIIVYDDFGELDPDDWSLNDDTYGSSITLTARMNVWTRGVRVGLRALNRPVRNAPLHASAFYRTARGYYPVPYMISDDNFIIDNSRANFTARCVKPTVYFSDTDARASKEAVRVRFIANTGETRTEEYPIPAGLESDSGVMTLPELLIPPQYSAQITLLTDSLMEISEVECHER